MLYKLFVSRNFLPGTISLHALAVLLDLTTSDMKQSFTYMKHLTNDT